MKVQSLGHITDLFFPQFDGLILDRGDYLVIRTPSNPTYYWGNFLLFQDPPGKGDFERWKELFEREIASLQPAEHMTFSWDTIHGETGEVQPFLQAGFDLFQAVVLTARQVVPPPKYNAEVVIRPLSEDWEWEQATQNQVACRGDGFELQGYQVFKQNQMQRYRRMVDAGLGAWFGAFLQGELVADLGVFAREKIGRFQAVGTHPAYRRHGICGTLVYQASRYAFEQLGAETLVMVADENYHAAKIYESVGFQPTEHQVELEWRQKFTG